jgi:2-C-methyl-D-erythritol 4-phosphate cytidylyltransferase
MDRGKVIDDLLAASSRKSRYHYRGDKRRKADERRAVIRRLVEAILSDTRITKIVVESRMDWIEEVARTVRRKVQLVLREDKGANKNDNE